MYDKVYKITITTALIYAVAGALWILLSDNILSYLTNDTTVLTQLQTYKGWFFVATTTVLLFFMLKGPLQRVAKESERRRQAENDLIKINTDLEKIVKKRTVQYEDANRDMRSFISTVSHELRAPLRTTNSYIKILEEDYGNCFDEEGLRLMNIIRGGTVSMNKLINDLYNLSVANDKPLKKIVINMTDMARAMCYEVVPDRERYESLFVIHPLPNINGDSNLMKQVWLNIISNAVKFTRDIQKPVIEISASESDDMICYQVKDNGTGFNPQYANSLFLAFKRLHSNSNYEGTGIGLSIVKAIVKRHGGEVSAEGKPERGATFCFSLPIADNTDYKQTK